METAIRDAFGGLPGKWRVEILCSRRPMTAKAFAQAFPAARAPGPRRGVALLRGSSPDGSAARERR